jgi:signal transduction histidine kinase
VRRRLVVAIAGVAAVAVVLLTVPLGIVLEQRYRSEDLLRLQRDTIAATRQIDVGAQPGDPVELPRTASSLTAYDRAGRRVAGGGPRVAPALVRRVFRTGRPTDTAGHGRLTVAVPLLTGETLSGAVLAERSDHDADRDALGAWLVLGAAALAIIGAATTAAVLLARRLALPLERLAVTAQRLGDGDFATRAAPAGIQELDAVGAALSSTAERLDRLVTRERAFSADASHQLRTPLQALRIELEAAELRGDAPPEIPAALAQVDRLQTTIDTLLSAARDAPGPPSSTRLDDVVQRLQSRWHGPLAAQGRPLRAVAQATDMTVGASTHVIAEILDVLVDNARKHGSGAITIDVRPLGAFASIDVSDEGSGFAIPPAEALERRSAGGDGHGIGLALAQSLAHAEAGRIVITPGARGPTVSLVLPAAPAA